MLKEKILLVMPPFWSPLIPPMGISCLKSYLKNHGCSVKILDTNTDRQVKRFYDRYYRLLQEYIPPEKQGNIYNIGIYVLQDHMMAHLHRRDEETYLRLIRLVYDNTFFTRLSDRQVGQLDGILSEFFAWLRAFFAALLEAEKPAVLGLSVYQGTLPASLAVFKQVKADYPHIRTIMGGGVFAEALAPGSPNYTFFLETTRSFIDHIVIGEGEVLLLKLLKGDIPTEKRVLTLDDIDRQILDLSGADIPDFDDLEVERYPHLSAYTARSCPFQCGFCSETMQWGPYRRKPARQVVDELKELSRKHRFQLFLMGDSLLNPVITQVARECIRQDVPVYWDGYLRAEKPVCRPGNALLWRRGGYYRARIGAESGSPRVLELMNKRITVEQIKAAISNLAATGIKTTTYWVIGYPGETEDDFLQTLDLLEEMKDDIYEADCNPFAFFLVGQVNSNQWSAKYRSRLLYPAWAREMLITQTWHLDCEPRREIIYKRLNRFVDFCRKTGIPNPYTLHQIYQADERWKRLHPNAVPSVLEFENYRESGTAIVDENRRAEEIVMASQTVQEEGDWGF